MIVAIFLHFASFFDMTLDRLMNFKTELHLQKKQTDLEKNCTLDCCNFVVILIYGPRQLQVYSIRNTSRMYLFVLGNNNMQLLQLHECIE